MKYWFLIRAYVKYQIRALTAHGVHSPFVYNFIKEVLEDERSFYAFDEIASLRKKLVTDNSTIEVQDFGAGSHITSSSTRTIQDIAKHAGRTAKYGRLLFRMVNYFESKSILELGTSLGLGTSYLAKANEHAQVISIEGSEHIAKQAAANFDSLGINNIEQLVGNFDDILPSLLQKKKFEFIFFDGNHREEATINYFNWALPYANHQSVFVFDDIHWTQGMENAWNSIRTHEAVTCSIDLFYFGIVFFNPEIKEKQHFVLRY